MALIGAGYSTTATAAGDFDIEEKNVSGEILASDLNTIITVDSAVPVVLNLCAATVGRKGKWVEIRKLGVGNITLNADGTDTIADSAGGGSIVNTEAAETWAFLILKIDKTGHWGLGPMLGSWETS